MGGNITSPNSPNEIDELNNDINVEDQIEGEEEVIMGTNFQYST